jgi:hypothetical protein
MTLHHPPESTPGHLVDDEDDGLYLCSDVPRFTSTPLLLMDPPEVPDVDYSKASVYVPVEVFMAMQKERDEYRRAMTFVNGVRAELQVCEIRPSLDVVRSRLAQICENVGMTLAQGVTHNDLVQQVREGQL